MNIITRFEEMDADGMFEELGYERKDFIAELQFVKDNQMIIFMIDDKAVMFHDGTYSPEFITMKELQAINKKCVELGWLKERD